VKEGPPSQAFLLPLGSGERASGPDGGPKVEVIRKGETTGRPTCCKRGHLLGRTLLFWNLQTNHKLSDEKLEQRAALWAEITREVKNYLSFASFDRQFFSEDRFRRDQPEIDIGFDLGGQFADPLINRRRRRVRVGRHAEGIEAEAVGQIERP
jgi:hypothetical protein